jgi:glyoxylase-like metal-dependent hydrolase (beta-lactamase superfamily II)
VDIGGTTLEELVGSIREKLFAFPDDTVVVPGHGPATTIGRERRSNPFLV